MNLKEKLHDFLIGRRRAYFRVFNPESQDVEAVMKDLAKFCRANESTFHPDGRVHAHLEGRREVFLRILEHIKMDPEIFWKKYGRDDL